MCHCVNSLLLAAKEFGNVVAVRGVGWVRGSLRVFAGRYFGCGWHRWEMCYGKASGEWFT